MTKNMQLHAYVAAGGFKDEGILLDELGVLTIALNRKVKNRPARPQEREALDKLAAAIELVRLEIARTSCDENL